MARWRGKREEPLSWAQAHHNMSMYLCLLHVESGVFVAVYVYKSGKTGNVRDTHTEVSCYTTTIVHSSICIYHTCRCTYGYIYMLGLLRSYPHFEI
jgi:hypothetical protein